MKCVSKRVREEAAVYCSAMADFWCRFDMSPPHPIHQQVVSAASRDLAHAASNAVADKVCSSSNRGEAEAWAEAEALLHDGWSPGDPVVRR